MLKTLFCIYFTLLLVFGNQGMIYAQSKPEVIVAKVNNNNIYEEDIEVFIQQLPAQAKNIPRPKLEKLVIEELIRIALFSDMARNINLDKTDKFKKIITLNTKRILSDLYIYNKEKESLTEKVLLKTYKELYLNKKKDIQVRAKHILVNSEIEAEKVFRLLENGGVFEELAKKYSTGPSSTNGGELGYFSKEQMVPNFSKVAFSTGIGSYSKPLQTKFGWHIIKVIDKRTLPHPEFKDVREKIYGNLSNNLRKKILSEAKKNYNVKIIKKIDIN